MMGSLLHVAARSQFIFGTASQFMVFPVFTGNQQMSISIHMYIYIRIYTHVQNGFSDEIQTKKISAKMNT